MCHVHTNPKLFGSYHRMPRSPIEIQHIARFPHRQRRMSVPDHRGPSPTKTTSTLHSSIHSISNLTMGEIHQTMRKSYVRIPEEMLAPFVQKSRSCRCRLIRFGKLLPVKPKRLNGCVAMRIRTPNPRIQ